jgi:hypothetical protein
MTLNPILYAIPLSPYLLGWLFAGDIEDINSVSLVTTRGLFLRPPKF